MPWINMTVRRGAISKSTQHALMARLTEVLMWWEKVPDTPKARKIMRGWIYEVDQDADYCGGQPDHQKPYYWVEIRIPIDRLDVLAKAGLIRDFTEAILASEGAQSLPEEARRVWVTIYELKRDDWGIGGHTDWLRDYTSAFDALPSP